MEIPIVIRYVIINIQSKKTIEQHQHDTQGKKVLGKKDHLLLNYQSYRIILGMQEFRKYHTNKTTPFPGN